MNTIDDSSIQFRGVTVAVGDRVRYRNQFGQSFTAEVMQTYERVPGQLLVRRVAWYGVELIDLANESRYPKIYVNKKRGSSDED